MWRVKIEFRKLFVPSQLDLLRVPSVLAWSLEWKKKRPDDDMKGETNITGEFTHTKRIEFN